METGQKSDVNMGVGSWVSGQRSTEPAAVDWEHWGAVDWEHWETPGWSFSLRCPLSCLTHGGTGLLL